MIMKALMQSLDWSQEYLFDRGLEKKGYFEHFTKGEHFHLNIPFEYSNHQLSEPLIAQNN